MQTTFYLAPLDKATLQDSKGNLFNDTKSIKVNQATIQKAIREGKAIKLTIDGDTIKMVTTQQVSVTEITLHGFTKDVFEPLKEKQTNTTGVYYLFECENILTKEKKYFLNTFN